jgi:hypothetical protein
MKVLFWEILVLVMVGFTTSERIVRLPELGDLKSQVIEIFPRQFFKNLESNFTALVYVLHSF